MRNSTMHPFNCKQMINIIFLFACIFFSTTSSGQLLQWNTAGNLGTETTEPSVSNDANIAAANLTQGTINAASNANRFGGSGWFNTGNTAAGNTLAEAVAGNDYIQFVVTPNAGFSFTPTSLVFFWDRSTTGPSSATLRSSADGFASDLGTVTGMVSGGAAVTTTRTINITTLTNISSATTFRLYGYGATATGGTGGFDHTTGSLVANVVLNGSTAPLVVNYSVTYNGNGETGGTAPIDGLSPYAPGSNVTVLNEGTLVRNGYTFAGWNTVANGSGTAYNPSDVINNISANTTLFAQWTINTYTVTYNGNGNDGGTAPVDGSSPYNFGSNVTVLGQGTLSLTGFNFNGWNTAADGSGTAYPAGGTITGISSNITLFAQWLSSSTFAVTYFGNGNTGGTAPVDPSSPYASGSNVTVLAPGTLVRTGYTFSGWNTAANGTGTPYNPADVINNISANTSLFAQWAINTYTVTYDGNGSDGGTVPVDGSSPYNYNSNVTVLGPGTMTRTNYNFTGWNTAADGSGTAYAPAAVISGIASNITLFARWTIITYTVTYNGNTNTGGTAPIDPSSPYAIGSTVTVLPQGTLVKTGYSFTGWNTAADGTGTDYPVGSTINNLSANTVLFAKWLINQYSVTYDGNGNTGGAAPVDGSSPYNFGSVVTVLANTGGLVKTGATFAGWNTSPAGTGTNYAATGSATFTLGAANVVLYAKWAQPLYEPFNYTTGTTVGGTTTGTSNNNWTTHSGTGSILVTTGSLNYTGLQASTGEKIRMPGANTTTSADINRPVSVAGSVAYYSFLLNVEDNTQLGTGGDYFTGLGGTSGNSVTALYGRVNIKSVNTGANYRLAISNSTGGTPTFTDFATDLSFGTTYLVVVKYDFNGAANDIATLWVNPSSLGGAEPAGGVSNSSGTIGQTNFGSVFLRNSGGTPKADIDEIRVAGTWAEVTPAGNFTITASAGAGGTISPSGPVVLSPGADQTFTISPQSSPCFDVADVLVDGVSVGAVTSYTFTNVSANHTISASFAASTFTQWTGAVNTDWNNPGNWTSCVPNSSLYVYIPANNDGMSVPQVTQQPVLTADASTGDLELGPGASVTIGSNTLTINSTFANGGGALLIGSPTSNLTFNSSANLSSASTIVLKNLTVNSGILTLESDVEITGGTAPNTSGTVSVASGAQIAADGFLTLKSNEFGTARVAAGDVAGNYITGNVIVERYIPANSFRSWRLLSVPTFGTSQTFKQSWQENNTPGGNIKPNYGTQITGTGVLATAQANGFDNIAQKPALLSWTGTAWAGVPNTTSTVIDTKQGYFLYIRGERTQGVTNSSSSPTATTLRTTGQLYQGDQTVPAVGSFAPNSFNLVGNLYASAIDFTQLTRTGGINGVANLFYIWDSKKLNGSSLGAYQTFSATNSFNTPLSGGSYVFGQPNTKIESGQAFFVQTGSAGGTIILTENSKTTNSANLGFRPVRPAASLVKIDSRIYAANSTDITDANVVVFDDAYSNKVAAEDALKFTNPAENFAIVQEDKTLAIEGRHTITEADIIQYNMWNLKQQQYKLELVPQNMGNDGLIATLEDAYLKTSTPVDLTTATTVTFTVDANPASQANRFKVVFNKVNAATSKQSFTIAPNPVENGTVNMVFSKQPAGVYQVRIVNNLGQTITSRVINHAGGNSNHVIGLPKGAGYGIFQAEIITPGNSRTTQRLMVNIKN